MWVDDHELYGIKIIRLKRFSETDLFRSKKKTTTTATTTTTTTTATRRRRYEKIL